jgi:hypothetical protein
MVALIVLMGCSQSGKNSASQAQHPPGYVAPASTDDLPLVDHPEYVAWSRFPVGASVVRKKEVTNDKDAVRVTTTLRLAQKTAEKVVVESQVTIERSGQARVENPPLKLDFPAKFRLPAGMQLEQFALPSLAAKPAGEETRQAAGREFQTQLFTWDERNEAGPMAVKYWRSDDVPGRMIRQEISGRTQTSVEEVVEMIQADPL